MSSLNRNNGWSHLPIEILSAIFQEVESSTYTLQACQLTCKGWSEAARNELYQRVRLDSTNVTQFIKTIQGSPIGIGDAVKSISFTTDNALYRRLYKILDAIVRYCPNIEMCYAEKYGNGDNFDMLFYAVFALQYKATLTVSFLDVSLFKEFEYSDDLDIYRTEDPRPSMHRMETDLALLHIQFGQFTALKTVNFIRCLVPDLDTFDTLIDRCSPNVHTFYFRYLSLSICNHSTTNNMKLNTNIKKIQIKESVLTVNALKYISLKFKALQNMEISNITNYPFQLINGNFKEWWDQLSSLCLPLATFKLSISNGYPPTIGFLKACLDMSTVTATGMEERIMEVSLHSNHLHLMDASLHKKRSSFLLAFNFPRGSIPTIITDLFEYLQEFHPTQVNGYSEEIIKPYPYVPGPVNLEVARCYSRTHWPFFKSVISIASQTQVPVTRFAQLIFPGNDPAPIAQPNENAKVRDIVLARSCIDHKALPEMSRYLPSIDRLTTSISCFTQTDANTEHRLQLFLPDTQLASLVLNLVPLEPHSRYEINDCRNPNPWPENLLNKAFKDNYLVKIETSTSVFVSSLQDGVATRVYGQDNISRGNNNTFLIWIKLKDWKEVLAGNGNNFIKLCNSA
ncbi:hypothetical protein PS15m_007826 [Mucor circinelloides]